MNCLVTGANGFIGRHLVAELRRSGAFSQVITLDNQGSVDIVADIRSNLMVPESTTTLDIDVCFHLAAVAKEPGYPHQEYFDVNHTGTSNVLDLCARLNIPRMVFTSTMMVFQAGEEVRAEGDPVSPDTAYGASKALAEGAVRLWQAQPGHNRSAAILRPAVVFGPGDAGNYTRLLGALKKHTFAFPGRRDTVKSAVYIRDAVEAIALAATPTDQPIDVFHLAMPQSPTIEEVVDAIVKEFKIRGPVPTIPKLALGLVAGAVGALPSSETRSIHPRRLAKLTTSTHLSTEALLQHGFEYRYPNIFAAVAQWRRDLESHPLAAHGAES